MRLPCALLICIAPVLAFADVEMHFSDGSLSLVGNNRVLLGDEFNAALWNGDTEEFVVIDRAEKTWMRIEPGFANDVASQVQQQMEQLLADLPPDERAMAEQQMQGVIPSPQQGPPEISVRRTGGREKIAGFACAEAEIAFDGGEPEEAVCIATAAELGISSADFRTLNAAMQSIAELASLDPASGPGVDFAQMGGIPIRTREIYSGAEYELVSIAHSNIDPARVAIPADFREVSIEEMMSR